VGVSVSEKVVCVCVCVLFVDLFQDDLRCLFLPHQVNHGGVQKAPAQVSLSKSHTTEESLRRRKLRRISQVYILKLEVTFLPVTPSPVLVFFQHACPLYEQFLGTQKNISRTTKSNLLVGWNRFSESLK
jgi:hypothetical protein